MLPVVPTESRLLPRRRYALLLTVVVALVVDVSFLGAFWPYGFAADFRAFWRAAGDAAPYAFSKAPFGNPPTTLLLLQPLRLLPMWPAFFAWNIAGFLVFLRMGERLYGLRPAILGAVSPAVSLALIAGQLSLVVAALVFGAFLSGPILCGILLGVAACLKPQMVFLAPALFLFTRDYRAIGAFVLTGVVVAVAAIVVFTPAIWLDWVDGTRNLMAVAKHRGALNLTISPMTYSLWLGLLSVPLSIYALYLCRNLPPGHKAAAVVAASMFASPYALYYDLAPLAVFAAVPILRSSDWRSFGAALSYSAALGPLSVPALAPSLLQSREDAKGRA